MFVVDCSDHRRMSCNNPDGCDECARCELHNMLKSEHLTFAYINIIFKYLILIIFSNAPVLILANKQDVAGAIKPDETARLLGVGDLPTSRKWHVQGCCALTGQGLTEGFRWLGANTQ